MQKTLLSVVARLLGEAYNPEARLKRFSLAGVIACAALSLFYIALLAVGFGVYRLLAEADFSPATAAFIVGALALAGCGLLGLCARNAAFPQEKESRELELQDVEMLFDAFLEGFQCKAEVERKEAEGEFTPPASEKRGAA